MISWLSFRLGDDVRDVNQSINHPAVTRYITYCLSIDYIFLCIGKRWVYAWQILDPQICNITFLRSQGAIITLVTIIEIIDYH
jgi:hypothetical protein